MVSVAVHEMWQTESHEPSDVNWLGKEKGVKNLLFGDGIGQAESNVRIQYVMISSA